MLIACPECTKQISSETKACPNCGLPNPFQVLYPVNTGGYVPVAWSRGCPIHNCDERKWEGVNDPLVYPAGQKSFPVSYPSPTRLIEVTNVRDSREIRSWNPKGVAGYAHEEIYYECRADLKFLCLNCGLRKPYKDVTMQRR